MKKKNHFKKFLTDRANSVSTKNYFRIESSYRPTKEDMILVQKEYGFDPRGYGGPDNIELEIKSGMFITTFSCAGSCD